MDERWKRRFIWQLHVFTKEIGFCESFLHVCRLNPGIASLPGSPQFGAARCGHAGKHGAGTSRAPPEGAAGALGAFNHGGCAHGQCEVSGQLCGRFQGQHVVPASHDQRGQVGRHRCRRAHEDIKRGHAAHGAIGRA
ncbi:hypothetical protein XAP6164_5760003 [Xanthomonas phaseoli pv. phaseoli]|nr:hypothetical protein XAP6164_5760003 [Xanthomonas phaseoli pv. phaseoli]